MVGDAYHGLQAPVLDVYHEEPRDDDIGDHTKVDASEDLVEGGRLFDADG